MGAENRGVSAANYLTKKNSSLLQAPSKPIKTEQAQIRKEECGSGQ